MKICFVSAGTFEHVQSYIDYFRKDHEVYFIALSPSPDRNVETIDAWFGDRETYDIKSQKWKYFISAFKAKKAIRKIRPDVVHAHYATSGGIAAWVIKHPNTVLTVHGSDVNLGVKSFLWKRLLKLIFSRCNYVNSVSTELERKVVGLNVHPNKVKNINVGIDFNKFYWNRKTGPESITELNIICNRSFKPVYDHMTLLRALVILKGRGVPFKLTLLGDGVLRDDLQRYVKLNVLDSDVSFLGMIANEKQVELFKEHNIYVSSSTTDGTSLSLLEAMASGLFPVVSDISANQDWIVPNISGLLFPVGDAEALAEYLQQILRNGTWMEEAIRKNQDLVKRMGDRKTNMLKIEELYNQNNIL